MSWGLLNVGGSSGGGGDASTLDGKTAKDFAAANHSHQASEITGLPTSLPANGGNADTVGNKKASDFATANHAHSDATTGVAGFMGIGAQTFAGNKTFNGQILPNGATAYGTPQARKLASGTAAATTTNCPSGAWYGQHD